VSEVPVDPLDPDGGLLRYRLTDDGYVLYSVGQNGVDDGGAKPDEEEFGWMSETGDMRLDVLFADELPIEQASNEEDGLEPLDVELEEE